MATMTTNESLTNESAAKDILEAFEEYLVADDKGTETIVSYTGDIKGFIKWLENKNVDFTGDLTRFYITSFKEYLIENDYTINTINKKINSLNSFNDFLISKKLCTGKVVYPRKDKIRIAKGSESEVEVFSDEEVEQYYSTQKTIKR